MDADTKERFDRLENEIAVLRVVTNDRANRLEVRIDAEMRETRREFAAGLNLVLERIGEMVGVMNDKYKDLPARVARLEVRMDAIDGR